MLCGWLAASAGHAYAAQVTASPAPHGHQAGIITSVTTAGRAAARILLQPIAHQPQALYHPASTLLAAPSFPGAAGVGAGIQNEAATALAAGCRASGGVTTLAATVANVAQASDVANVAHTPNVTDVVYVSNVADVITSAASGRAGSLASVPNVAGVITSAASGRAGSLAPGLEASVMGGQAGAAARPAGPAASPVLQLPGRGAAPRITTLSPVAFTGPGHEPVALPGSMTTTPGTSRTSSPSQPRQSTQATRPSQSGRSGLARQPGYAGSPAVRSWRPGGHHRRAEPGNPGHRRRPGPSDKLAPGTATQTDPTSSGGGTGAAHAVAQGPPHADSRNPTGRLVRRSVSRWPAGRLGASDPAVSPD